jgi:hypothetical protein
MIPYSIHPSEVEDFERELRRYKLLPDDLELTADDPVMTGTQIQATRGTVTVRNNKTGASRTYSYMTWVADFARDLDAGIYLAAAT